MALKKAIITILSVLLLLSTAVSPVYAVESDVENINISDIENHWASPQLTKWVEQGLLNGYEDGTVRPDHPITRAEFVTIVNHIFGFTEQTNDIFIDVKSTDWFASAVAKAHKAGYINGYPDQTFRPDVMVTRENAAVILRQAFRLTHAANKDQLQFSDAGTIQAYAKPAVETLFDKGYVNGYPDHTFRPDRAVSRAEAVAMMDQIASEIFNVAGTYTEQQINGNAIINTSNVTLQDIHIAGNLYLAEGIGSGDATLENVTVLGTTFINGGGSNSIHIRDSNLAQIVISDDAHQVRVVVNGTVTELIVSSQAMLEIGEDAEIGMLVIGDNAAGTTISFSRTINNLTVGSDVTINGTTVKKGSIVSIIEGVVTIKGDEPRDTATPSAPIPGNTSGGGAGPGDNGEVTDPDEDEDVTDPDEDEDVTDPDENGEVTDPDDNEDVTDPDDNGEVTDPDDNGDVTSPDENGEDPNSCDNGSMVYPGYADETRWTLVWGDEFDCDSIDETKWNFVEKGDGFGNQELQFYTRRPENARIEAGNLVIEAHEENYQGKNYTSAKLDSKNKGDWQYGRFEIRAKLPEGQGMWPAIWMMPTDSKYGGWPTGGEIDIMEFLGHEPEKVYGTIHFGNPHQHTGGNYTLPSGQKFSDDFHTFSIEWTPGEIKWFVDDILFSTKDDWFSERDGTTQPYPAPFDQEFYLQLNLAVGGQWPGNPDETTNWSIPKQMLVDYVRVYEYNGEYEEPGPRPGKDLGSGWTWLRESSNNWSIEGDPKVMSLRTEEGRFNNNPKPHNILLRDPLTEDFTISTKINFNASVNFEFAGLIVYVDDNNYVSLGRSFSGNKQIRFTQGYSGAITDKNTDDTLSPDDVYLKIEKNGTVYRGFYSSNGIDWTEVTDTFDMALPDAKVGIFTRKVGPASKTAQFSEFEMNGNSISF